MSLKNNQSWIYQARRSCEQTNAAGGALNVRVQMNPGQIGILKKLGAFGPATASTLLADAYDEDGIGNANLIAIGAAASNYSFTNTSTAITFSRDVILGPGEYIAVAAATTVEHDTLVVNVTIELNTPAVPLWATTGSAGTPVLSASTISAANTMVAWKK